jgi:hypothetical protein
MIQPLSTHHQHPPTMVFLLVVLNQKLLSPRRTLIQILLPKVLLRVLVPTLPHSSRMASLYLVPRIDLVRLRCIAKSVASIVLATPIARRVSSHTTTTTSMSAQREKLPRRVELALSTLIHFQFAMVKMHHVFAHQSPPRRHPLLSL